MLVLLDLVRGDCPAGCPAVPLFLLFPALKEALSHRQGHKLALAVLEFLAGLATEKKAREALLHEDDWTDVVEVLERCAAPGPRGENSGNVDGLIGGVGGKVERHDSAAVATVATISDDRWNRAWADMLAQLCAMLPRAGPHQARPVMDMFLRLGPQLPDAAAQALLEWYAEERLLGPSADGSERSWLDGARSLTRSFLADAKRPRTIRLFLLERLKDALPMVEALCSPEEVREFAGLALECVPREKDPRVLEGLAGFAVLVTGYEESDLFDEAVGLLSVTLWSNLKGKGSHSSSKLVQSAPPACLSPPSSPSLPRVVTQAFVRLFLRSATSNPFRTRTLFLKLLDIAGSDHVDSDARVEALGLLFRLRADADTRALRVVEHAEGERIAAVLGRRTVATASGPVSADDEAHGVYSRESRGDPKRSASSPSEEQQKGPLRESRSASGLTTRSSASNKSSVRSDAAVANTPAAVVTEPLWMYPDRVSLPEAPARGASAVVFVGKDAAGAHENLSPALDMARWLERVVALLQSGVADWDVYAYVLAHLGPQLANKSLFAEAVPQLQLLRSVLCEQVKNSSFHEPPPPSAVAHAGQGGQGGALHTPKKADVAVCLMHILTMLIAYHEHFRKDQQDELVRSFALGLGSWDRTPRWAIHALGVCALEMPLSTSKSLDTIVRKMSQIITQSNLAVHILEFLVVLARLTDVWRNFREEEIKMVFGVSFRYLQYVRDRDRTGSPLVGSGGSAAATGRGMTTGGGGGRPPASADDLPQYVYALAFHVIIFWFMALKMEDRPAFMAWIAHNLTYADPANPGREVVEEQAQVTIDMMQRVAFCDADETAPDPAVAGAPEGAVLKRSWLVGMSVVTIETLARSGISQVTRRRPSATRYSLHHPRLRKPPRHQVAEPSSAAAAAAAVAGSSSSSSSASAFAGILPEHVLQELYAPLIPSLSGNPFAELPVPLPEDDMTARALSSFDRISPVDGHKVGIVFVAPGQTTEVEILRNEAGSLAYATFLSRLGTLVKLKGAGFNTQGLDRSEAGVDGEYTYAWRDRVSEMVFHVATMMPTRSLEEDQFAVAKKAHVGNDFVNIVWNESGREWRFDTLPSEFNYVYIVITPEERGGAKEWLDASGNAEVEQHEGSEHGDHSTTSSTGPPPSSSAPPRRPAPSTQPFYKVHVLSAPGFPELSPAAEPKLVSARSLPTYIRALALNASVFSLVWARRHAGTETVSSWRNRLREINKLRERCGATRSSWRASAGAAAGNGPASNGLNSSYQGASLAVGPVPLATTLGGVGGAGAAKPSPQQHHQHHQSRASAGLAAGPASPAIGPGKPSRVSAATFLSDATSRNSVASLAEEMERAASEEGWSVSRP
ncbi:hypothetical protein BDY21DRAFT_352959 [Lineolata rhizophorae]|uniref:Rap-GAP domain-containing protein n=1 Tax=Lineolata rhizophorae TaxID=578093 RepID=A0A6A6NRV7_9PEZI|nr:hypothetical protein BDY21DRAFT_352959 [Lineolata rhizophorae]